MRIGFAVAGFAVAAVIGVGQVRGDLVNSGFATEGVGGAQDAAGWAQASHTERHEWGSHDGDGFLMALIGFSGAALPEVCQDHAASYGNSYTFTFWHEGDAAWSETADVSARLIWLDSGLNELSQENTAMGSLQEAWTEYSLVGAAPVDTAFARVQFDTVTTGGGGAQKFDDTGFSVVAIPEPGSLALMAFTLIGLIAMRRRRG